MRSEHRLNPSRHWNIRHRPHMANALWSADWATPFGRRGALAFGPASVFPLGCPGRVVTAQPIGVACRQGCTLLRRRVRFETNARSGVSPLEVAAPAPLPVTEPGSIGVHRV